MPTAEQKLGGRIRGEKLRPEESLKHLRAGRLSRLAGAGGGELQRRPRRRTPRKLSSPPAHGHSLGPVIRHRRIQETTTWAAGIAYCPLQGGEIRGRSQIEGHRPIWKILLREPKKPGSHAGILLRCDELLHKRVRRREGNADLPVEAPGSDRSRANAHPQRHRIRARRAGRRRAEAEPESFLVELQAVRWMHVDTPGFEGVDPEDARRIDGDQLLHRRQFFQEENGLEAQLVRGEAQHS
eukprot:scaffold16_cov242-Pinguiococcus_pyrenoidosus.AAC.16